MHVTHANVCRINDIHTAQTASGPMDIISMEFVGGETLGALLPRGVHPTITHYNGLIADSLRT